MNSTHLRRHFLGGAIGAGVAVAAETPVPGAALNVTSQGAAGDGVTMDTAAIQKAIDSCAEAGGGAVYFPAGRFLSGGLILRDNVHLYLSAGAVLLGSRRLEDFPVTRPLIRSYTDNYTERSLIFGEGLINIGIHGEGMIDGQGAAYEGPYKVRPYLIRIVKCRDVSVTGVKIVNSPMWVQHYLACDDVLISGITVKSRVNGNNDGIDIDACRNVVITGCNVWSGDDAIVLKSTLDRVTENVAISNCVLSTHCNALKLGTESNGGFRNITISNISVYENRLSGIAVEMVDGGVLDGLNINNVTMRGIESAIFFRLGNRARPFVEGGKRLGVGVLRNVRVSNVTAEGMNTVGCPISGIPGHAIENVTFENVDLCFQGGGAEVPGDVAEAEAEYPEYKMFGVLPAYAFFCRHIRGLRLRNVTTRFEEPELRPALVLEDVKELEMDGCCFDSRTAVMRMKDIDGAFLRGCRLASDAPSFVEGVSGVRGVAIVGSDLRRAGRVVAGKAEDTVEEANALNA